MQSSVEGECSNSSAKVLPTKMSSTETTRPGSYVESTNPASYNTYVDLLYVSDSEDDETTFQQAIAESLQDLKPETWYRINVLKCSA